MAALLLYGDTEHNAALRHEVPITIMDAFMLLEDAGRTWIMCWDLEAARIAACRPDATLLGTNELGFGELLKAGLGRDELDLELTSRAAARTQIKEAIVDFDFPLAVADRLRSDGISISVDEDAVAARRRAKSDSELAGIRRAQAAAEAAMGTASSLLARAGVDGDSLTLDGSPLTAERVRAAMRDVAWGLGALMPPDVIVASVWAASRPTRCAVRRRSSAGRSRVVRGRPPGCDRPRAAQHLL